MIGNEQMTANRYGHWAKARKLVAQIQTTLNRGGVVSMGTYTQVRHYYPKHVGMFKATRTGAYVQHGKGWECIDYCGFRFTR